MAKLITISGYPGSGTSTVVRILSKETELRAVNTGDVFRAMAEEAGMTIAAFADHVRSHPDIDLRIDKRQVEIAREGDLILEGRLAGFMTYKAGLPGFRVWISCSENVRVERVAGREEIGNDEARARVQQRESAERERYLDFYGFDLDDMAPYDLVLDSENLLPHEIAERILHEKESP